MTKEEILAMEPGPELDTLVAEKVMNHPMPDFIPEDALDLYHLEITQDHYADPNLVICKQAPEAICKAALIIFVGT